MVLSGTVKAVSEGLGTGTSVVVRLPRVASSVSLINVVSSQVFYDQCTDGGGGRNAYGRASSHCQLSPLLLASTAV